MFALEKQHLRPVTARITTSSIDSSISRTVRKDNTIIYKSNRYSVPLGTYKKDKEVHIETDDENHLIIREQLKGAIIADHQISHEKGELIQHTQHTRDRSKGISAYIASVSERFKNTEMAYSFLEEIRKRYPRYTRDQLQLVSGTIKSVESTVINEALEECVRRSLYSATEFSDVVNYIKHQHPGNNEQVDEIRESPTIQGSNPSVINEKPQTREVSEYLEILKGASV